MNKLMLVGTVLGAVGVTASDAVATYNLADRGPDYAEIITVQPVKETIRTPCQIYKDMAVTRQRPVKDQHQIAGTATGAVISGLLGNQIGGGTDEKIATVVGTVSSDYAGNKVQEGMQERDTYITTGTHCSTMHDNGEKVIGYDVKYMLDGKAGQIRMERDPGSQILADKNSRLILSQGEVLR